MFHLEIVGEVMYERINEALVKGFLKEDTMKLEDDPFV